MHKYWLRFGRAGRRGPKFEILGLVTFQKGAAVRLTDIRNDLGTLMIPRSEGKENAPLRVDYYFPPWVLFVFASTPIEPITDEEHMDDEDGVIWEFKFRAVVRQEAQVNRQNEAYLP